MKTSIRLVADYLTSAAPADAVPLVWARMAAHRVMRLCEAAAETASRERWQKLEETVPFTTPVERAAQLCLRYSGVKYPVVGEPAVNAALMQAADLAREVRDSFPPVEKVA